MPDLDLSALRRAAEGGVLIYTSVVLALLDRLEAAEKARDEAHAARAELEAGYQEDMEEAWHEGYDEGYDEGYNECCIAVGSEAGIR